MGRKKSASPKPTLPIRLGVRANESWAEWLGRFRAALGLRHDTDVVDRALKDLAKRERFDPPPPRF